MKKILYIGLCMALINHFFISPLVEAEEKKSDLPLLRVDYILVRKKDRILHVYYQNKLLKSYKISLGFSPVGHKEQEGDGKTPEGKYVISLKNPKSRFHLSLKVSYPSKKDIKNAQKKGEQPGGDIMLHGLGKDFSHLGENHVLYDWTLGCIAVTDKEIAEIYKAVDVGTPIEIQP